MTATKDNRSHRVNLLVGFIRTYNVSSVFFFKRLRMVKSYNVPLHQKAHGGWDNPSFSIRRARCTLRSRLGRKEMSSLVSAALAEPRRHFTSLRLCKHWSGALYLHIKRVLATEFNNFEKGAKFREGMQSVLGVGVFNSDDDMWK